MNHPEMTDYEKELRETIRLGKKKQEALNPQKYRYSKKFDNLTAQNTHIVAVVMLRLFEDLSPNNFIVTAYQKKIGETMNEPIFKYDEISDTMYIAFAPGEIGTGVELNEHILLRINETENRVVGLTLFDYSVLAQRTEIGYRSLPLNSWMIYRRRRAN